MKTPHNVSKERYLLHFVETKQVITLSALWPQTKFFLYGFASALSKFSRTKGLLITVAALTLSSFIYVHGPKL